MDPQTKQLRISKESQQAYIGNCIFTAQFTFKSVGNIKGITIMKSCTLTRTEIKIYIKFQT